MMRITSIGVFYICIPQCLIKVLYLIYCFAAALLSRFSRVRLSATPQTAAHQALLSLGFSRQEHWGGLPFPSPMQEREKGKWSRSVVSDSQQPQGPQPTRLLHPWDFPGKRTGVGCQCLLHIHCFNNLQNSYCTYSHFTDEETVDQIRFLSLANVFNK